MHLLPGGAQVTQATVAGHRGGDARVHLPQPPPLLQVHAPGAGRGRAGDGGLEDDAGRTTESERGVGRARQPEGRRGLPHVPVPRPARDGG